MAPGVNTWIDMPQSMVSFDGKRQPRALVVGLRRVVKDPRATVAQRLEACKLLAIVEGYIPHDSQHRNRTKGEMAEEAVTGPDRSPASSVNVNRLKELAGKIAGEKAVTDRPPVSWPENRAEAAPAPAPRVSTL